MSFLRKTKIKHKPFGSCISLSSIVLCFPLEQKLQLSINRILTLCLKFSFRLFSWSSSSFSPMAQSLNCFLIYPHSEVLSSNTFALNTIIYWWLSKLSQPHFPLSSRQPMCLSTGHFHLCAWEMFWCDMLEKGPITSHPKPALPSLFLSSIRNHVQQVWEWMCNKVGQRRAPKEVGMSSRTWNVATLEFGVMGQVEWMWNLSFSCEHLEWVE